MFSGKVSGMFFRKVLNNYMFSGKVYGRAFRYVLNNCFSGNNIKK